MKIKQNDRRPYARTTLYLDKANEIVADVSSGQVTDIVFNMKAQGAGGALKVTAGSVDYVTDGSNGQVEYKWAVGDTDAVGMFDAEFEVTWADGRKQTFPHDSNLLVEVVAELG